MHRANCGHFPRSVSQPDGHADGYAFAEYEAEAYNSNYPASGKSFLYPALAMCGEAGELAEKSIALAEKALLLNSHTGKVAERVKKLWRNRDKTAGNHLSDQEREALASECGDVLWYLMAMARELGLSLEAIALANSLKVRDREKRGVVKSEGDKR